MAALLGVGASSAWADETPVWSMDFSTVSTSSTSTISNFTSNGDYQVVGQSEWTYKSSYATETGTHFAWARQRSDSKQYGFCFRNSAVFCQSTSYAMTIIGLQENYKVTIVTSANGIASSFTGTYGGTWTESVNATNTTYTYTMSSAGDLNLMVAAGAYVYSVTVVEISGLEATTYTVKYQNAGGTDLKDPVVYDTYVGETYTASASDMATFYNGDSSKKYIYASGNTSTAATATAASNVITLVFNEYDKIAYTVTAKDGATTLGTLAEGNAYTDGSTRVYWNKFKNYNDQWYETTADYGKTITAAGNTDVAFTASDISYFYEFETLSRSGGAATVTETSISRSNNTVGRMSNSSGSYATLYTPALSAGVYTLYMPYYNGNTPGDADKVYVYITNDVATLGDPVETFSIIKDNNANFTTTLTVPEGYFVAFQGAKVYSNNSQARIDYLTLTPYKETKAISAAGWATYCSPYALDFSSAIDNLDDAYIVTGGADGVLSKTSVKGSTVPANTGLLLKGEGACTIPVAASSSTDVSTNKLVGKTAEFALAANDGYVLMNDATNGLAFYKNTNAFTVGANTAYLPANFTGSGARGFFLLDGSDATGIGTALMNKEAMNSEVYNLQGQRVAAPTKGLYIVNGKKAIVK